METLSKTQLEKAQFIEQSRGRLRELSVAVSSNLQHSCLYHRVARSCFCNFAMETRMYAHSSRLCDDCQLPELRFDLREPPRTERSEFDDEAPGGMYD
eukprot:COSAG02_NODE_1136_length_14337_cov_50.495505_5_plen_98_part_00